MSVEVDNIYKKWALGFLKRNWRSFSGLIVLIALLIMTCFKLNIPLYVILGLAFGWILIWLIKSGRFIFPTNKYLIIFCIKNCIISCFPKSIMITTPSITTAHYFKIKIFIIFFANVYCKIS